MTTCEPLAPKLSEQTEFPWMSSAVVFPAKTLASQAERRELKMVLAAVSGVRLLGWLASYDQPTSSWKTCQISFQAQRNSEALGLAEFSETWPKSGMMRNGNVYQRQPLALHIPGNGYGSWPTPTARDHSGGRLALTAAKAGRGAKNNLRDFMSIAYGWQYPPVRMVEYMMGFPTDWASLSPTETPSSPKSPRSSAKPSSKR